MMLLTIPRFILAVKEAETLAQQAQEAYEANPDDNLRSLANEAGAKLIEATNRETLFWKQKAKLLWMENGDQNTSFFHSFVKGRMTKLKIRSIKDISGKLIDHEEGIKTAAVEYFSEVFNKHNIFEAQSIQHYIPLTISTEDNHMMSRILDNEEIKKAVWDLNPNSAAGPDGFNGYFFRTCWEIIKGDVIKATQEFFLGISVPQAFGSTFITLIPKKDNCHLFSDFRPISLSTFMSKINTRILASRLQVLIPKMVSKEQSAYQKGKGIDDQVLMASEMLHNIDKQCEGGKVIIKLDMAKAFDKIEWSFLGGVLDKFGFNPKVQDLLLENLVSTHVSILINGCPTGFFKMKRGVKQGDPLSPLLFIIASELKQRSIQWLLMKM
ncbi:unnamed protein product [Cuscuta campestris]|uniref:Reverse transcriptase domain-containing protein n=1 Tax=Cuscuta campestris TaxID=132261 RepID=A0A484NA71_9ASTE|nr:unnamed protein product [Cuscuta campestris]